MSGAYGETAAMFRVRQCNELRMAVAWLTKKSMSRKSFPGAIAAKIAVELELYKVQVRVAELCEPWFEVAQ